MEPPAPCPAPPTTNHPLVIISYNINGMSGNAKSGKSYERRQRVVANLEALGKKCDALCLQDTRCAADSPIFDHLLTSTHTQFHNHNPDSPDVGGTTIFVRKSVASAFDITERHIVPGYIQSLTFKPKQDNPNSGLSLINVYMRSNNQPMALSFLSALRAAFPKPQSRQLFACGDWNLTQHRSDSSGQKDHFASTPALRQAFSECLASLNLTEVYQPLHTRVSPHQGSSRLDRFYTSLSIAEQALTGPEASLPHHPHLPGTGDKKGPSDHFPVMLSYVQQLERGSRFKIPEWLARNANFLAEVRTRLVGNQGRSPRQPVRRLLQCKRTIRQVAMEFMKTKTVTAQTKADAITTGLATLREATYTPTPSAERLQAIAARHPPLNAALQGDLAQSNMRLPRVQAYIKDCFAQTPLAPPLRGKPNFAQTAKHTLPKNDRTLTHVINALGDSIRDPVEMATALKETWSPIWSRACPPKKGIDRYLSHYTKRLRLPVPHVTLTMVQEAIKTSRDSSTGPDGMPFSVYRSLCDLVGPLLQHLILHLSQGNRAHKSFNHMLQFFFPKDDQPHVDRLRPISVSNTDNRIVANVIRQAITPGVCGLLDKSQRAFLPGATIDTNVQNVNYTFYTKLAANEPYHILLHDFDKAYDSTSRTYLFTLLARIGIPPWTLNVMASLFDDVVATPLLPGRHGITIDMPNGLKQGCPLSPLLFNLALDPLLTAGPGPQGRHPALGLRRRRRFGFLGPQ